MAISRTKLEEHLDTPRATPLAALEGAKRRFLAGERLDMQELAVEIGVSRATLYRWVGTRERLLGEVLWSLAEADLAFLRQQGEADGLRGKELYLKMLDGYARRSARFKPLKRFIDTEPEPALRVLTSKESPMQRRSIEHSIALLDELVARDGLELRFDTTTLAFVIVRVVESFLWSDLITGEAAPELGKAVDVIEVLLT